MDAMIFSFFVVIGCFITAAAFGIPPIIPLLAALIVEIVCVVVVKAAQS